MGRGEKLLARMRLSHAGWRPEDFRTVYLAYGFDEYQGHKHTKYWHPEHLELWTTVPRSSPLSRAYAAEAVDLIDQLLRLEAH